MKHQKPVTIKDIAKQRIQVLFKLAEENVKTNPALAARYVELARKIAMSARICLPTTLRRRFCKNCNMPLVQGYNCRVRIKQKREPHVVVTCLNCGFQTRFILKKTEEKNK